MIQSEEADAIFGDIMWDTDELKDTLNMLTSVLQSMRLTEREEGAQYGDGDRQMTPQERAAEILRAKLNARRRRKKTKGKGMPGAFKKKWEEQKRQKQTPEIVQELRSSADHGRVGDLEAGRVMTNGERAAFVNRMTLCPTCGIPPIFTQSTTIELRDQIRVLYKHHMGKAVRVVFYPFCGCPARRDWKADKLSVLHNIMEGRTA